MIGFSIFNFIVVDIRERGVVAVVVVVVVALQGDFAQILLSPTRYLHEVVLKNFALQPVLLLHAAPLFSVLHLLSDSHKLHLASLVSLVLAL